jgi:PII-like signaling protein
MITDALKLSIYFGESMASGSRLAADALMDCFDEHRLTAAALVRGIEGFGINRRIHAQRFPDVSTDVPLLAIAVDDRERIRAVLDHVDGAVPQGLVTLEHACLATGEDVAGADFPDGPGKAGKLTIHCGSGEQVRGRRAYRAAVALLRGQGASGAIVLPGVDGRLHGRRQRVRPFSGGEAPMTIISVGPRDPLRRALPHLAALLREPVVTLEPIAQVKHDGELLELPPTPAAPADLDVWQTIRVYTRRTAKVNGRPLYSEFTRRLREAGAAGATTILGDWGFSSDEPPHGDKLGRVASHRPTYTVYIDRPEKVAQVWPVIDEVTAEHGIVTSLLVPGYRERAGETVHGTLEVPEQAEGALYAGEVHGAGSSQGALERAAESPWLREMRDRIRDFTRLRGVHEPVVRVTLADGERFFLYAIEPGPGREFLTLYPHPERYEELLETGSGRVPPRAVVVPQASIAKIELLTRPPRGTRSLVTLRLP